MTSELEVVGHYEASQGKEKCRGTLLCIMTNDEGLCGNANSGAAHLCRVFVALAVQRLLFLHHCACEHGLLYSVNLHGSFSIDYPAIHDDLSSTMAACCSH